MNEELQKLFDRMCDPKESEAHHFAEKLGSKADEEAKNKLIELVKGDNWELTFLAAKALSKTPWNSESLDAIFEVIFDKNNKSLQGTFVQLLEDFDLFAEFLVTQERSNGLTQIQIKPWQGDSHSLEFEDETYTAWISTNPEFETSTLRFGYNSLVVPSSVYDYDMNSRERKLL